MKHKVFPTSSNTWNVETSVEIWNTIIYEMTYGGPLPSNGLVYSFLRIEGAFIAVPDYSDTVYIYNNITDTWNPWLRGVNGTGRGNGSMISLIYIGDDYTNCEK